MRAMVLILGLAAGLALAACDGKQETAELACGEAPPPAELPAPVRAGYLITIDACEIDPTHIALIIETNLPLPVEVVAGVNLVEMAPGEIYIGHAEQIRLEASQTVHKLDLTLVQPPLRAGERLHGLRSRSFHHNAGSTIIQTLQRKNAIWAPRVPSVAGNPRASATPSDGTGTSMTSASRARRRSGSGVGGAIS